MRSLDELLADKAGNEKRGAIVDGLQVDAERREDPVNIAHDRREVFGEMRFLERVRIGGDDVFFELAVADADGGAHRLQVIEVEGDAEGGNGPGLGDDAAEGRVEHEQEKHCCGKERQEAQGPDPFEEAPQLVVGDRRKVLRRFRLVLNADLELADLLQVGVDHLVVGDVLRAQGLAQVNRVGRDAAELRLQLGLEGGRCGLRQIFGRCGVRLQLLQLGADIA